MSYELGVNEPTMLEAGTRVEVRSRFDRSWTRGFTVESASDSGYQLRRRSDGAVLPAVFDVIDVRPERKRQGLWWA